MKIEILGGILLVFLGGIGMVPLAFAPPISVQINATILAVDLFQIRPFANAEIRVENANGTLTFVPCQNGNCTFTITNQTVEFAVRAIGQFVTINGSRVISTNFQIPTNVTFITPVGAAAPAASGNFRPGMIALLEGDIIAAIQAPFITAMGAWFFGIIGLLPMLMIYLRSQSIGPPMITGMILIAAFLSLGQTPLLPPEVNVAAYVVLAMMIAGLLYRLFKRED